MATPYYPQQAFLLQASASVLGTHAGTIQPFNHRRQVVLIDRMAERL